MSQLSSRFSHGASSIPLRGWMAALDIVGSEVRVSAVGRLRSANSANSGQDLNLRVVSEGGKSLGPATPKERSENVAFDAVSCATVPVSKEGGPAKWLKSK